MPRLRGGVQQSVLLAWLAACFFAMAAALALTALLVGWPVLFVAAPLAGVGYLFYYHASGRLTERLREHARRRRSAEQRRAGDGPAAGPFAGRRRRRRRRAAAAADGGARRTRATGGSRRARQAATGTGMSPERARSVLGVDRAADPEAVRAAYRSKVKEVHPDRGGDAEAFKRVTTAYETLGGE